MDNLVLPFRGQQFSVALNAVFAEGDTTSVDLSAVIFNRQGQYLDVVHPHKHTALMGAICTSQADPGLLMPEELQQVPGQQVVHVLPKAMDPAAEVIILVASVAQNPGKAQDLSAVQSLEAVVTYAGEENNAALTNSVTHDLLPAAQAAVAAGTAQSLLVAVVFLDQPGWTIRWDHTASVYPSWSLMVPDLQAAIVRVKTECSVPLDAACALEQAPADQTAIVGFSRLHEDRSLDEAARFRLPPAEDPAGPATAVDKLRLDVGWKFWKKGPEDEIEGAGVEFVVKFYDALGEEVQSAGTNEREAQGVVVGRPEPEEVEEEEEEAAAPAAEEDEEEGEEQGEGEEGEGGESAPPPPPPEPAEDPYEFKERDVMFITLSELPKEVRSIVVLITNYAGAGFGPLRHVGVKLWDIAGGDTPATSRPLAEWHHLSGFEQEADITQVALLKMYKEYKDTAWNMWKKAGVASIADLAALPADQVMTMLKEAQEKHKEWKATEAKALADAEESGEEPAQDIRPHVWRYRVTGLALGGDSLEAVEHDIKDNVLNFDGPLQSGATRTSSCARVQFGGEKLDTYFGGYQEDLKSGPGLYAFATGAFYVGEYKAGKRDGKGVMLMPDGGKYVGEFAADRFHGQGQYRYPDGSVYTGSWEAGKKHGPGTYWDTSKGCLRGSWVAGILQGGAQYDQPTMHYEGDFIAGVPAGDCKYTITSHRMLDMTKFAASHILEVGPTLIGAGQYAIPAGSGAPPQLDEEGNPIEDPEKPPLPSFPKYEGMTFQSTALPCSIMDIDFPPPGVDVPVKGVPGFNTATGLVPPVN